MSYLSRNKRQKGFVYIAYESDYLPTVLTFSVCARELGQNNALALQF